MRDEKNHWILALLMCIGLFCLSSCTCKDEEKNFSKCNEFRRNKHVHNIESEIKRLSHEWAKHRKSPRVLVSSHSEEKFNCKAYRDIIKMGKPALPAIIAEMRSGDNFLWFAVMDITGVKPTDIGKSGNVTDLYLKWWDTEGKNKFTELN